jgi:hypothetical protein
LNATEVSTPDLDAKDGFPIFIGAERNNAGNDAGRFFQYSGALSKVRIHSGELSLAQIAANYDEELPAHPGITPAQIPQPPLHRFSFNNAAGAAADGTLVTDSLGGLTAVIRGTGATFDGSGVVLPGGASSASGAYIDLPNGIVSSKSRISLEIWSTQTTNQSWCRLMSFNTTTAGEVTTTGNPPAFDGSESLAVMANLGGAGDYKIERLGGTFPNGADERISEGATVLGTQLHHVITYDPAVAEWRIYRNGFLMEVLPETQGPTTLEDVNNWIGRSEFNADNRFNGVIDEFRVYNYALQRGDHGPQLGQRAERLHVDSDRWRHVQLQQCRRPKQLGHRRGRALPGCARCDRNLGHRPDRRPDRGAQYHGDGGDTDLRRFERQQPLQLHPGHRRLVRIERGRGLHAFAEPIVHQCG